MPTPVHVRTPDNGALLGWQLRCSLFLNSEDLGSCFLGFFFCFFLLGVPMLPAGPKSKGPQAGL